MSKLKPRAKKPKLLQADKRQKELYSQNNLPVFYLPKNGSSIVYRTAWRKKSIY